MTTNGHAAPAKFDPTFTQSVIDAIGPKCTPRNRQLFSSLIKHIHEFAYENELTIDEWMTGVKFMNSVGQISTNVRNEGQRISDVLGLETVVDEIAHQHLAAKGLSPTSSTILGPFWSPNAPFRPLGGSIIQDPPPSSDPNSKISLMHGKVINTSTGQGIPNAVVDIWQASLNGKYDFQDPEHQSPNNLRGKFRTDEKGDYWFYCLHPTAYSLPTDGPAGVLLNTLDRHPMRPAHIHLMVTAEGYKGVTTQLYPSDDPYLKSDTVFAVKDDLILHFKPVADPTVEKVAALDLEYDVFLAPEH